MCYRSFIYLDLSIRLINQYIDQLKAQFMIYAAEMNLIINCTSI